MASSRPAALELARTSTIPHSRRRARSGAATRNAYPIPVVPGSIPRMIRGSRPGAGGRSPPPSGVLQDLFGHVEVRVDLDDIVQIRKFLDETRGILGMVAM